MANQIGFSINIPDDIVQKAKTADEAISKLATTSETTADKMIDQFKKMANDGVQTLIDKVGEAKTQLSKLGTESGFQKMVNDTKNAADSVVKLISVINDLSNASSASSKKNNDVDQKRYEDWLKRKHEELKENERIEKAKRKATQQAIKRQNKEFAAQAKANKLATEQQRSTMSGALKYSAEVRSINEQVKAINYLKQARANLVKEQGKEKQYEENLKRINAEIRRQQTEVDKLTNKTKNSHRTLMNTTEQLQRSFALLFSVSAIKGYVNRLATVRGEFEMQRRSLEVLLQNKAAADKLWNQTVQLAVKSPFTVKELITQTKQLAAYRIESDKLYETNKMLSDVSAGLGVDMNRLILAYGQVKAANFLRGTELRQFSEAGVNMLSELAKRFSELEGRTVSVGEVFERVSKRMVTFKDVEAVFKSITSEGGIFYKMQEKQSETLKGQIMNLKDSIELMLNTIGAELDDTMKAGVAFARFFVENWRGVATVIELVASSMALSGVFKFVNGWRAVAKEGINAANSLDGLAGKGAKLNLVLKNMWKLVATHPILALVAAFAALGVAVYNYGKSVAEANKKYDENARNLVRQKDELENIQTTIEKNNTVIKTATAKEDDLKKARNENLALLNKLKEIYPEVYKNITKQKDGTIELNSAIANQNELLSTNILLQSQAKGKWFQQDLTTNATQALEQQQQYNSSFEDLKNAATDATIKLVELKEKGTFTNEEYNALKSYIQMLSNAKDTSSLKSIQQDFYNQYSSSKLWSKAWQNIIKPMLDAQNKVHNSHSSFMSSMNDLYANFKNQASTWRAGIERNLKLDPEKGRENAANWVKAQIEGFQIYEPEIQKLAFNYITKGFNLSFPIGNNNNAGTINDDPDPDPNPQTDDRYSRRTKLVQDMRKAYEDLNKTFGKTATLEKILDSFSDEAKELGIAIEDLDVSTEEGFIKALESIEDLVKKDAKAFKEWKKAIREARLELDKTAATAEDERLKRQIDEMFSNYDLSIELEKMNIPPDLAKQLFNVDVFSLDDLKEEINKQTGGLFNIVVEMQSIENATGGDADLLAANKRYQELKALRDEYGADDVKTATDYAQKITEMEIKEMQERLKKYTEYLLKSRSESVNAKLEELRQLREIESLEGVSEPQKASMREGVRKETQEKIDKLEWEDFKKSPLYESLWTNLDTLGTKTIELLLNRLKQLKTSLKELPEEAYKEIQKQITELDELIMKRNPFRAVEQAFKDIKDLQDTSAKITGADGKVQELKGEDALAYRLKKWRQKQSQYKSEIDLLELIKQANGDINKLQELGILEQATELGYLGKTAEELNGIIFSRRELFNQTTSLADSEALDLNKYQKARLALKLAQDETKAWGDSFSKVVNGLDSVLEAFGVADDNASRIGLQIADTMLSAVMNAISLKLQFKALELQAKALGTSMNAALGVVGWVAMAVEAAAMLFSAIFSSYDKTLERQIDSLKDKVENLERAYKKLEKAIESAYSSESLKKNYDAAIKNLQDRINATNKMISLEEKKKATDKDKLQEYTDQMNELLEEQAELLKEQVEKLGGSYDIRSTTREFVDAWIDAYKETGNGLQGLKDNFKEFFKNILLEQAVMSGAGAIMQPLLDEINASLEDDFKIDSTEYDKIQNLSNEKMKQLDEFMNNMFGENGIYNKWITDTESGELSGLQKGIQGVTEQTAEIIESLLNSIRFFVAKNTDYLKIIADNATNNNSKVNPVLSELKAQTTLIMAIRDMFSGVIKSGHPTYGGSFIKVAL